jgi:SAM-dependent methyltransferase
VIKWRIRELAKIGLNWYQAVKVALLRLIGVVDFPVPPNSNMRRTSALSIKQYYWSSLTTATPILTMARFFGVKFDASTRVLDFGCGAGSQLMTMMAAFPDATYSACDVDPSAIKFVKKSYPTVDAYASPFLPPLKFADNEMDLIYTVSTFSHFDQPTTRLWLKEFFRICKPGGLLLATVEGNRAIKLVLDAAGSDNTEVAEKLRTDGFFYKEYVWLKELQRRGPALRPELDHSTYFGDTYGHTIMTPEFVRKTWTEDGFEIVGIAEGVSANRQDLIVLRRPLNS